MTAVAYREAPAKKGVGLNADATLGVLLVSPILMTMTALVFYPMVRTLWDSLHRVNPMQAGTPFVGLENYTRMLSDGQLAATWVNTLIYVVLAVLAETVFGVLAAALINQLKVGRQWVLAAVILPWALPGVVNSVIWLWIYQPGAGLLNGILSSFGLPFENHVWFNDRTSAIIAVTVVHVWRMMPLTIVIVLAAMQSIPADLYEAARIDGASRPQMFALVTLPLVRSALAVAMTNATVNAFNLFDEAWVLAGSSLETRPILVQIYLETFQNLRFSYGMALSVVITFVSLLVSLVYVLRVYRNTRFD
ncbi:multiple sugar transport system permease protein [Rhizobium leguminosarum]|uniref:Multiple sugar transport system permease protein n=3 Tax=Rhizobium leguminosarum TaxID=384 RepID=A0A7W9ZNB3_RHILE|nr:sugar ABC transporter permease [Rhizobium leguminosarum]ACI58004.1 binding-protein-dependent transport systems inner membrane component [Rhizobium leguminosarum bv. trifolii WSM2304]EJB06791.1 permease component of ABC-type sugar transporter [Rhizobium leguminosarum bv. trifolii WSM597]MBB5663680.1 multiple sugar transport system permease protein [Rhizobium leguminosarum]MBB6219813.1 multiple sugar transport system permease protein [Rhizobium leguminosarum]NYJ13262.1 multiple sugar transpor